MRLAHRLANRLTNPAGVIVITDFQAAGRGRRARAWQAPAGSSLLASFILAPPLIPPEPLQLPLLGGLALAESIHSLPGMPEQEIGLKWPNDLVWLGGKTPKKLAGLLVESGARGGGLDYAVLGFGINVHQTECELPTPRPGGLEAASLFTATGQRTDRTALLISLARSLSQLQPIVPAHLHARWDRLLVGKGRRVTVGEGKSRWQGRFVATSPEGALIIEEECGEKRRVDVDEVHIDWHEEI